MLFSLMLVCAVAAILVIAMAAFSEFRELWFHPYCRDAEANHSRLDGTRPK
jgi:hypothetical protein